MTPSSSSSRSRDRAGSGPRRSGGRGRPRSAAAARACRRRRAAPVERPPSSGRCTEPRPRSARGSSGAPLGDASRVAGEQRRRRRPVRRPPASRATSAATAAICCPDLQVALGVDPVEVARVERDQPPGGVEDVGGGGAGRRSAYRTALVSTAGRPSSRANPSIRAAACPTLSGRPRPRRGGRRPRRASRRGQTTARHRVEGRPGQVGTPGQGAAHLAGSGRAAPARSPTGRVLGDQGRVLATGGPRSPGATRGGGSPRPAGTAPPSRRRRGPGTAASRPARARTVTRGAREVDRAPPRTGRATRPRAAAAGGVDGCRPSRPSRSSSTGRARPRGRRPGPGARRRGAGLDELHRAVQAVAVGQGEGVHAVLGGPRDQGLRDGRRRTAASSRRRRGGGRRGRHAVG